MIRNTEQGRRHFIPLGAPMKHFCVQGTPLFTPVWNQANRRYDIMFFTPFRIDMLERRQSILIKAFFICDGASVPKRFWDSIGSPYASRYLLAAILHDALYMTRIFDRVICDRIFLEFMQDLGVALLRRHLMHFAVRAGGWKPWNKCTLNSLAEALEYVRLADLDEYPEFIESGKWPEDPVASEGMMNYKLNRERHDARN